MTATPTPQEAALRTQASAVLSVIERRAERAEEEGNLANLVALSELSPIYDPTTMVIFGRRGAGKTHTLLHLLKRLREDGDVGVYIDMRKISSNAGMYEDLEVPFGTRCTNILVDVISEVHNELYASAVLGRDALLTERLDDIGPALDAMGAAVTEIRVTGETAVSRTAGAASRHSRSSSATVDLSKRPTARGQRESLTSTESTAGVEVTERGRAHVYIHLGTLDKAIGQILEAMGGARLWILIDEWSGGVPYELQPILADMIRRIFASFGRVAVKIGAVEHQSRFLLQEGRGYVGLELGADTAETLSLDAAQVIGASHNRAVAFIRAMLNEHFRAAAPSGLVEMVPHPIALCFQSQAFDYLVLASEGNPRDAINLCSKAARTAKELTIRLEHVISASDDYFWNTKYKNIEGHQELEDLFEDLMDNSLSRGRRTILFERSDPRRRAMDKLYDRRLVHLIRSGVRVSDSPRLYDLYAIDFGCYAERILRNEMRWANDGFVSPSRFVLDGGSESWKEAVLRRRGRSRR